MAERGSGIEPVRARRVLVERSVLRDRGVRERLEAMVPWLAGPDPEIVARERLDAELAALGRRAELPRGGLAGRGAEKELVAFTTLAAGELFPGYRWDELRNAGHERRRHGVRCQTGVELQTAVGCPFDCTYCPYNRFVCVGLDHERFAERAARLAATRRTQLLYKLNNRTDTLALEPEYGLAALLIERFASLGGPSLLLYSKGDAVEHLLDLDHRGRTVASFTLTPAAVAGIVELGAPPPAVRLAALAKMARAGYPVRVRFSPIVPVRGWLEAYQELVAGLFAVARPDMVTLWTLSMVDVEDLDRIVPTALLDPDVLEVARAKAPFMRGRKGAPFPPAVRAAVYRAIAGLIRDASPGTEVSLCLETPEVWAAVGPVLGPPRGAFPCNCGPRSVPGAAKLRLPCLG